jgi:hypothetical protein
MSDESDDSQRVVIERANFTFYMYEVLDYFERQAFRLIPLRYQRQEVERYLAENVLSDDESSHNSPVAISLSNGATSSDTSQEESQEDDDQEDKQKEDEQDEILEEEDQQEEEQPYPDCLSPDGQYYNISI